MKNLSVHYAVTIHATKTEAVWGRASGIWRTRGLGSLAEEQNALVTELFHLANLDPECYQPYIAAFSPLPEYPAMTGSVRGHQ